MTRLGRFLTHEPASCGAPRHRSTRNVQQNAKTGLKEGHYHRWLPKQARNLNRVVAVLRQALGLGHQFARAFVPALMGRFSLPVEGEAQYLNWRRSVFAFSIIST
jgi:hypothetical protein